MYIYNCNLLKYTTTTPTKKKYICKQIILPGHTNNPSPYTNVNIYAIPIYRCKQPRARCRYPPRKRPRLSAANPRT